MQLFLSPTSPFGRIVLVGALNAGIRDLQLNFVDPWSNPQELQEKNPFSQIPTLITHDGHAIYDSFIIADYLLDHPVRNAGQAATLAFARILIEQAVKYFSLLRYQGEGTPHPHIARAETAVIRALPHTPALQADSGEFAELVLGIALGYVQLRLPDAYHAHVSPDNRAALQTFAERGIIRLTHPDVLAERPAHIGELYARLEN